MATSTRSRYFTILSAVALLFTMLTPLAAVAQDPPEGSWDFVTSVPGSDEGRIATSVWTGEHDVVYALTRTGATPYDMQVQRFDHGSWHLELDMPGYWGPSSSAPRRTTSTSPATPVSSRTTRGRARAAAPTTSPSTTTTASTGRCSPLPAEVDGLIVRSIAGVPARCRSASTPTSFATRAPGGRSSTTPAPASPSGRAT